MKNSKMSPIDVAIYEGAIRALKRRAKIQADCAKAGESSAEKYPEIIIRTGEAVIASSLAKTFSEIADELEQKART